jgi:hypothetical protein
MILNVHVPSFFCLFFGGFSLPFFFPVATFSVGAFRFLPANRNTQGEEDNQLVSNSNFTIA